MVRCLGPLALFVLAVSLAAVSPLTASEVPFSNEVTIETPFDFARSLASADFDRDGDLDLVAVAQNDDDVAWWENTAGDGSAWSRHDLDVDIDAPREVVVGDIDGDGDLDLVVTAFTADLVSWWENDLDSGAACGSDFCEHTVANLHGADAVQVADLDRDGDLDVVVTSRRFDMVRWYENQGDGSSWTQKTIATGFDGAQRLWVGDFDGDGDPDVLGGAGSGDGGFAWWENDVGSGAACGSDWCEHSLDTGLTFGAAAGDLDGDGDLDLLRSEAGSLTWWENHLGDGSSWIETEISTERARLGLAAVDFDGDGDLDVVGLDNAWLENLDGDASSWAERSLPAPADNFDLEIADLDGDGDLDFAAAQASDDRLVWWRNETLHRSATFAAGLDVGAPFDQVAQAVAADLDGDGDLDLVAASETGAVRWSENDGTPGDGGWIDRTIYTGTLADGVVAADFDGDGDLDLAVCDLGADAVIWLENDGTPGDGGWLQHTVASGFESPLIAAAADLDGDGDVDLVASSPVLGVANWFENDGSPADGEWVGDAVVTGVPFAFGVATADIDGDGILDVLAAGEDVVVWVESDGTPGDGIPSDGDSVQRLIAEDFLGAVGVVPCDVDGDGDVDVVATAQDANEVAWFENDGSPADGTWAKHTVSGLFLGALDVVCGDLDGDGDADLAATAFAGDEVTVWLSDGSPADGGWQEVGIATGFDGAASLAVTDLDRDGRLDLVATGFDADVVRWWRNAGGQFALPTSDALAAPTPNAGTADVLLLEVAGAHRGRTGDADAELATLELLFEESAGDPLTGTELDARVDTVRLYLDDGDGAFEPDTDDLDFFALGSPFSLTDGVLTLTMVDGDPGVQMAVGADLTWWLAVDLAASAADPEPDTFRVTHVTDSSAGASSTGEMATTDLPLTLEYQADVPSSLVDVNDPPTLDVPIGAQSALTDEELSLDVSGSFSDPESGVLEFEASGLPGSLTISAGGVISGTPTRAEIGEYSVTVTATDPGGLPVSDTFDLTVVAGPMIFMDGFESGDTKAWSSVVP